MHSSQPRITLHRTGHVSCHDFDRDRLGRSLKGRDEGDEGLWLEHERTRLGKRQRRLVNEMSTVKDVQNEKEKTYRSTSPSFHFSVFLTPILAL
jgi:hypothetical protein